MPVIILHQPQIPPNTGNAIRLAANCGFPLHLIRPLGFSLDEHAVRRSGMDYRELADLQVHDSLDACLTTLADARLVLVSTRGALPYHCFDFSEKDALLFGNEGAGLPDSVWCAHHDSPSITIPMRGANRSLNLANAVAIIAYDCWRQLGFPGAASSTGDK